jgi:hypothetical protein
VILVRLAEFGGMTRGYAHISPQIKSLREYQRNPIELAIALDRGGWWGLFSLAWAR